jgi:5,10-methenyltetrahydromethanopterin hydrogenase
MEAASFLIILGWKPFEGFQPKIIKKIQRTVGQLVIENTNSSAPKKQHTEPNRSDIHNRYLDAIDFELL